MTGALFDVADEMRGVFVRVMVADAVEAHLIMTARTAHLVAMHDAAGAFTEGGVALRAAHANFHVLNGIMHDTSPANRCDTV